MLRDIILWLQLRLNPTAAQQVQAQIAQAVAAGTNQGANGPATQQAIRTYETTWRQVLNRIGALMLATFGARAIFNFVQDSIMAFAKFDQKLQQSIAIMDNVDAAMRKRLGDSARTVSRDLNIAADELAAAYYYLASAGLTADQSLKALPITAIFAKAGLIDLAKAAEYLTEANTALGYKSTDAQENLAGMARVADVLAFASKHAQGTIENFAQALTNKAGNSLRLFGKDIEEGAAALAVMANQGTKGALAGERLDIFLRQGAAAAIKHAEAFKAYNIAVFDTQGKMRNLADISDDLTKALGGLSDEQQVVALQQLGFQTRTVAFVKAFIGQGQAIRDYERDLRSAAGFAETVAKKQLLTPIEQWGLFKQKIEEVKKEIGENFIKTLGDLAKTMGDETDPNSIIGALRVFSMWLTTNTDLIEGLGTMVVYAVKGFMWFMELMNAVADTVVFFTAGPVAILAEGFNLIAFAIAAPVKIIGRLVALLTHDTITAFDKFGDELMSIQGKISDFAKKAGEVAVNAAKDSVRSLKSHSEALKPFAHMDTTISGKSKNNADQNRTGSALDLPSKAETDKLRQLQDELTAFIAKHTATREDDQLAALKRLEEKYAEFYGKKIPQNVKDSFTMIKRAIADEAVASSANNELSIMEKIGGTMTSVDAFIDRLRVEQSYVSKASTAWKEYETTIERALALKEEIRKRDVEDRFEDVQVIESVEARDQALHDFIDSMKRQRDAAEVGSKEWETYRDALDKAEKALKKLHDEEAKSDKNFEDEGKKRKEEQMMRRIEAVGTNVAKNLGDAFGTFFEVLFVGTRRGADAFEQLGRKIAGAGLGALADWAMAHAKADFISAADETWKGLAALADPFTAFTAPMHFAAAAEAAAAGALWAALGGSIGGGASAVGNSSHGISHGNASDVGGARADSSTQVGPEINIYLDGIDPKNPRHQQLVGETIREFADRSGGSITIR